MTFRINKTFRKRPLNLGSALYWLFFDGFCQDFLVLFHNHAMISIVEFFISRKERIAMFLCTFHHYRFRILLQF